ncbi:hypothetical protein, partial [Paenibacillus cremeus]|uniref:hypothetical protein n=1 Tax=Paenibacillus cremeus TaxID=2163881 RepID=UPI001C947D1D
VSLLPFTRAEKCDRASAHDRSGSEYEEDRPPLRKEGIGGLIPPLVPQNMCFGAKKEKPSFLKSGFLYNLKVHISD